MLAGRTKKILKNMVDAFDNNALNVIQACRLTSLQAYRQPRIAN